ncbi:hypothetical protein INR49_017635 [Caranx melampygus]|nr:hypothetical protein INR49_017635 [Caranx melampygus]
MDGRGGRSRRGEKKKKKKKEKRREPSYYPINSPVTFHSSQLTRSHISKDVVFIHKANEKHVWFVPPH